MLRNILILMFFLFLPLGLCAEPMLIAPSPSGALLLSGPSQQADIIMVLHQGNHVLRLTRDPDTHYSLVRVANGAQGWVNDNELLPIVIKPKPAPKPVVVQQSIPATTSTVQVQTQPVATTPIVTKPNPVIPLHTPFYVNNNLLKGIVLFLIGLLIGLTLPRRMRRKSY